MTALPLRGKSGGATSCRLSRERSREPLLLDAALFRRLRKRRAEWECGAARVGAPMLCLCTTVGQDGLTARLLVVRSERPTPQLWRRSLERAKGGVRRASAADCCRCAGSDIPLVRVMSSSCTAACLRCGLDAC